MPRKSPAQRTMELTNLIAQYDNNPSAKKAYDWDYNFCVAMLGKLTRKKALTKKMRAKIDFLVAEGFKTPPVNKEADEMERLSVFLVDPSTKAALSDFAHKRRMGWSLSERQKHFADKLIVEARSVEKKGFWVPSEVIKSEMETVLKLRTCYADSFWASHGGGARALHIIDQYLSNVLPHISEKTWESAKYAVRGKLKQIENPRFLEGDMCFSIKTTFPNGERKIEKLCGIICSKPFVAAGNICYEVLLENVLKPYPVDKLKKR